jgi:hypothetical protein
VFSLSPVDLRSSIFVFVKLLSGGTQWLSWLTHCATSQKIAGAIPDGVIDIFH